MRISSVLNIRKITHFALVLCLLSMVVTPFGDVSAKEKEDVKVGGGYAINGTISGVSYMAEMYDASNGLPTSDANCVLCDSKGYVWIGGYSGIIRYDGNSFERLDASNGLTSGRALFEDSHGRIWVGTNDNGIAVIDKTETLRFTYEDGLRSSSIRCFAEDEDGDIYVGSTSGICYVDKEMKLHDIDDERINDEIVTRLVSDSSGNVYGNTKNGDVFMVNGGDVLEFFAAEDLDMGPVSSIFVDRENGDRILFATEEDRIFIGKLGDKAKDMKSVSIAPITEVYWMASSCGSIWLTSENHIGYLDDKDNFHLVENLPMNNSVDMVTGDYQGNLWFASSRQGVMKVVTNNFRNVTDLAGLPEGTVNATCLYNNSLYIGTDTGLYIVDSIMKARTNKLTEYLKDVRIRCIMEDNKDNLLISTYQNDLGLVVLDKSGNIKNITEEDGLPDNQVRTTAMMSDGRVLVGTNGGVAILKDGKVQKTVTEEDGLDNTVILTVCEGKKGLIYAGTDGGGIVAIDGDKVTKIGREEGLTSDVILRIKKDENRGIWWIITSNSIQYIKGKNIITVESFPYNNNFDLCSDDKGNIWILSSYGLYCVNGQDMVEDKISDYRVYTIANGLYGAPTSNSYSELDEDGNLYISGRTGVSLVNINNYYSQGADVKTGIASITCEDGEVKVDEDGNYTIPAVTGRIQITPAVLDYTMNNPKVRVFLEGSEDSGMIVNRDKLSALEFTNLAYGNYNLHIEILDNGSGEVLQENIYPIKKEPKIRELMIIRVLALLLIVIIVGIIVWRIMSGTVIRRQYEEIRQARDEADRANSAKSRFLANMSHEIRTPINTIMGMDEMILREDSTDVPKPYFMSIVNYALDIRTASESLLGLINDLLDMSKIESGKMHLVEREYDVCDYLRPIISMGRVRAMEKDLFFNVDVDGDLPVRMYGDAEKIKQIIVNLLTNALKYTNKGGFTLSVSLKEKKDDICSLRISVKDTGIGVKPEDMDKLFTAYERLDEEKNIGVQGTGLGLDISRRFAELMDGRLWCESEYGQGSEFILEIDQKAAGDEIIGRFVERDDEKHKGPYVPQFIAPDAEVLVVDDNPMNLTVIKGLLKPTKMFITTAESGEECLEKIKYGNYDVVLLDHMMPGMDGVETLERIRQNNKDLPVYVLTANVESGGEEFYLSKGFTGYLEKPIDSKALECAIMKHLPAEIMMVPERDEATKELDEIKDSDGAKDKEELLK